MSNEVKKPATDYCETKACGDEASQNPLHMGWKELYFKEDWWAIWLGIGIVVIAYLFLPVTRPSNGSPSHPGSGPIPLSSGRI